MAKDIPTWYHGGITGDEATKILTRFRQPGAFLLRDSQNKEGAFTLTLSRSFEKTDHFVDVKHYRIAKNRLQTLKSGKRNFPSMKDLEKCVHQQEAASGETLSRLGTPVEISMIKEWDQADASWRDKFGVQEGKHDKLNRVKTKASKDSNKHSSVISTKFPRFISRKKKEQESNVTEEDHSYVQLEADNSRDNELDAYLKRSSDNGKNVMGVNYGIYTVNKDRNQENTFNKSIDSEKQAADHFNKDNEVETLDKNSNRSDDNQMAGNVSIGISMSTVRRNTINNGVPESHSGSADQVTEFNNGIYMSSEHANTVENKIPVSHNDGVSSSVNQNNASNSGIYLSSEHATKKENRVPRSDKVDVSSSANQNNASNSGIYLSSEHATNKDNKSSRSNHLGIDNSDDHDGTPNSGIYSSSAQQAFTKDNKVPGYHKVAGSSNIRHAETANIGIYMSPEQTITKDNEAPRSHNLRVGSSADQDEATNSGIYM